METWTKHSYGFNRQLFSTDQAVVSVLKISGEVWGDTHAFLVCDGCINQRQQQTGKYKIVDACALTAL